jgi:predicted DNA-binding transcriptional regulator AlpA
MLLSVWAPKAARSEAQDQAERAASLWIAPEARSPVPGPGRSPAAGPRFTIDDLILDIVAAKGKSELLGLAEVAELLGRSRRQATRLTARSDFPEPIARLRATPVWRRADVERWAKTATRGRWG